MRKRKTKHRLRKLLAKAEAGLAEAKAALRQNVKLRRQCAKLGARLRSERLKAAYAREELEHLAMILKNQNQWLESSRRNAEWLALLATAKSGPLQDKIDAMARDVETRLSPNGELVDVPARRFGRGM